ncbi:MAG: anthranilate synthase component I [Candidatus Altiarchaeota archaeon]
MEVCQTYLKIGEKDPEKAYQAVKGENTYLLESIEGSEKKARYSFIGFNPVARLSMKEGGIDYMTFNGGFKANASGRTPLEVLESLTSSHRAGGPQLARFSGGFVGYIGYDMVRYLIELEGSRDSLKQPDCEFVLTKNNIIFDHIRGETYLIENHFTNGHEVDVESSIRNLEEISGRFEGIELDLECDACDNDMTANTTRKEYMESVRRAKEYIREGDIFQTVLSMRLEKDYPGDKFQAYLRLKEINPSPYMYYLDFGDRKIVGSSPETLARVEKNIVSTYPIAGTRPRGSTPEEDKVLEDEMLADPKERAEHLMLVDLGRNDVGRVAEYGSVEVSKFMVAEKYSHVQHISSEVTGRLREDKTMFDALESIFPAGTVSGAPKVRAMEIIEELEPERRGIYAGCIGYFSFNSNMDTAIAIRTIVFEKDNAYVQAGAGIVADSKPEKEYEECMNKGKALLKTLGDRT